jgi:hypothetical protein
MKPRIVIETRPGGSVTAVVEGKAELGFALVSEIVPVPEVKLVGPVPGDLQSYTVFAAGVSSSTMDAPRGEIFRGVSPRCGRAIDAFGEGHGGDVGLSSGASTPPPCCSVQRSSSRRTGISITRA